MTRDQAELFADDLALVCEGLERFIARIEADSTLREISITDIAAEIHESGALAALVPRAAIILQRAACLKGGFSEQILAGIQAIGSDDPLKH